MIQLQGGKKGMPEIGIPRQATVSVPQMLRLQQGAPTISINGKADDVNQATVKASDANKMKTFDIGVQLNVTA